MFDIDFKTPVARMHFPPFSQIQPVQQKNKNCLHAGTQKSANDAILWPSYFAKCAMVFWSSLHVGFHTLPSAILNFGQSNPECMIHHPH
jgi:hypothetical protein